MNLNHFTWLREPKTTTASTSAVSLCMWRAHDGQQPDE